MRIVLISQSPFSIVGGLERLIPNAFKILTEKYGCDIKILSTPHYKSLCSDILEEFKEFKVYRDSDYSNKLSYIVSILFKMLLNKSLQINYNSIQKHYDLLSNSDIILITDPLLILSVKDFIKQNMINSKIVYWDHGSLSGYFKMKFQKILYKKEVYKGIKNAHYHLVISSEIAEFIKNINPDAKVNVVYNPVPTYTGTLAKRSSYPTFLYIGRLDDGHKNISFLLTGLSKLKNKQWCLKIIGKGEDENKLKDLANKLGISDRIEWLGFKKEPFSGIIEATALLLTSRWEAFGMVLVEANQRGIPVISSDCHGPKDIVIPGKNGFLYKEGDINNFIQIVDEVIDGRLQFDTPENIAKTAERFREDIVVSNIYEFLKRVSKKEI